MACAECLVAAAARGAARMRESERSARARCPLRAAATRQEAETRLQFLEQSLDANRRHAQIWYWSWLTINGGGVAASTYTAATTDNGGDRAFNIVQASQAALGLTDMLVLRPMPGRDGADPLREAARAASTSTRA